MAAQVFTSPVDPPNFEDYIVNGRFNFEHMQELDNAYIARLQEWIASSNYPAGRNVGEVVRWPRGDGYAQYMVLSRRPLRLIHLPLGDAWDMDDIFMRGLRVVDIDEQVASQRRMAELFGRR